MIENNENKKFNVDAQIFATENISKYKIDGLVNNDYTNSANIFDYIINTLNLFDNNDKKELSLNKILEIIKEKKIDSSTVKFWLDDEMISESPLLSAIEEGYPEFKNIIEEIHNKYLQNKSKMEDVAKDKAKKDAELKTESMITMRIVEDEMERDIYSNTYRLTTLNDKIINLIIKYQYGVELSGLLSISDEEAEKLSKHNGPLFLNGLTTLSDKAAEYFSQHKGRLSLMGLESANTEVISSLALHHGTPDLPFSIKMQVEKLKY